MKAGKEEAEAEQKEAVNAQEDPESEASGTKRSASGDSE